MSSASCKVMSRRNEKCRHIASESSSIQLKISEQLSLAMCRLVGGIIIGIVVSKWGH